MIIRDNFCQFCTKTCCEPSFELSRLDGSDVGLQHMVSMGNKKKLSLNDHQILGHLEFWSSFLLCVCVGRGGGEGGFTQGRTERSFPL